MSEPTDSKRREIWTYVTGFALALALTCGAFAAVLWPLTGAAGTLAIVFGLALIQMVLHFRCFLHISLAKTSRDDLQLVLFASLIILLMVSGTIVVLVNLRERMM